MTHPPSRILPVSSKLLRAVLSQAFQAHVGEVRAWGVKQVAEPELFPEVGIWHPLAPAMYEDLKEYLNWCASCPPPHTPAKRRAMCVSRNVNGIACRLNLV